MKWNYVLDTWLSGVPFTYPQRLKKKFQWNTSSLSKDGDSVFQEKYKVNPELPDKQDWKSFSEHIVKSQAKYVISFYNPSKDTLLVIPKPRQKKNFATIKDFTDNASLIQQKEFWKEVAILARKEMKKNKKVYISAHGLGVPYFHIRICQNQKYYFDSKLEKT